MKAQCFNSGGKRDGDVNLPDDVFTVEPNLTAIYHVVRAEQANNRQGSHKTKGRSEVSGGGKKPWRQKGTGNARQGSTRSPQWRGGGTVFGPFPRSYRIDLPRKLRKVGIRSILATRAKDQAISVLRGFTIDQQYSTRKVYDLFKNMGLVPGSTVVFLSDDEGDYVKKSFSNIRNIQLVNVKRILAPEVFYAGKLVIAENVLGYINDHYKKETVKKGVNS